MIYSKQPYEVCLQYKIDGQVINGMLHSFIDINYTKTIFLVPGIFGDRCDSRALFVRLSRRIAQLGYNVVRFDYIGGGVNMGDYSVNDFDQMTVTLVQFIEAVRNQFTWFNNIGMIGFSEGGKFCIRSVRYLQSCVEFIGFCNALLVQEEVQFDICRPKLLNGKFVYDSDFGVYTNFSIVENYKEWYIESSEFDSSIIYAAICSDSDSITKRSIKFIQENNIPMKCVKGSDHLFTCEKWVMDMLDKWVSLLTEYWPVNMDQGEQEYFVHYKNESVMVKTIIKERADKTVLFVHGLGQNKSGPSFLYRDIADKSYDINVVFFDFIGAGDSTGSSADMSFEAYLEQLSFMIDYTRTMFSDTTLILLGTGTGNLYCKECPESENLLKIYLFPNEISIWDRLSDEEQLQEVLDTNELYLKYDWIEEEFRKAGNVYNRSKGMLVRTDYLKKISNISATKDYVLSDRYGLCVTGSGNQGLIVLEDNSYLLMSAKKRMEVIKLLNKNIFSKKKINREDVKEID